MSTPLYCSTVFGNELFKKWGFSNSQSLFLNGSALLLDAVFILLFGYSSKILGLRRQIVYGLCILIVVPFIGFYNISGETITFYQAIFFIVLLIFSGTAIAGYALTYVAKFFPMDIRYSGIAVGDTLGMFFIAGNTPLIFQYLTHSMGVMGPAFFIAAISALSLLMLWSVEYKFCKKTPHHSFLRFQI